jgi:putative effector of murein hydrolase
MRASVVGVLMGISVALTLKNEKQLTSSVIRASLTTEIMFIIILGLVEIH